MIDGLTRAYLLLIGLSFLAFGGWMIADPLAAVGQLGLNVSGENAAFEMRGIYGGVSLALGLASLIGATMTPFRDRALFVCLVYFGGYAFARIYSAAIGNLPTGNFIPFSLFEIAMFLIAAGLFVWRRSPAG